MFHDMISNTAFACIYVPMPPDYLQQSQNGGESESGSFILTILE
jgi:hypothetical protein